MKPLTPRQQLLAAQHFAYTLKLARQRWGLLPYHVRVKVTVDDLAGPAVMGLCQAAKRYNPRRGVAPEFWIHRRVWGEMNDYLRSLDLYGRKLRARITAGAIPGVYQVREEAAAGVAMPSPYPRIDCQIDAERITARFPWLGITLHNEQQDIAGFIGLHRSRISQLVTQERSAARAIFGRGAKHNG